MELLALLAFLRPRPALISFVTRTIAFTDNSEMVLFPIFGALLTKCWPTASIMTFTTIFAVPLSRIQIKVMLYWFIAWCVGKPFIAVLVLYNLQCKCCACVGERLIYYRRGHAWASLVHWACVRLGHAIGPRHPSY